MMYAEADRINKFVICFTGGYVIWHWMRVEIARQQNRPPVLLIRMVASNRK